jgi:hypothetical protein
MVIHNRLGHDRYRFLQCVLEAMQLEEVELKLFNF